MPHVLLVCTANRCRSPMAMVILRQLLNTAQLSGQPSEQRDPDPTDWHVTSAGTWAAEGLQAMPNSQTVAAELGLDLSLHHARAITDEILQAQDLVLVMERGHREALVTEFPEHAAKIHLLSALAGPPFDINDPAAGTIDDYRDTARLLASLLHDALPEITARARRRTT